MNPHLTDLIFSCSVLYRNETKMDVAAIDLKTCKFKTNLVTVNFILITNN